MARNLTGSNPDSITSSAQAAYATPTTITLAGWVYPTSFATDYMVPVTVINVASVRYVYIYIRTTGKISIYYGNPCSDASIDPCPTGALSTNTWSHTATMCDGTNIYGFINGATAGSTAKGIPATAATSASLISGYDPRSTGRGFTGRIADLAFWNVALTQGELTALAQGARPNLIRPANLLLWYPVDGLQSPEIDLSGSANSGTLSGTTLAAGPPTMPFTPLWPSNLPSPISTVFRRTRSHLGTRTGSRQVA